MKKRLLGCFFFLILCCPLLAELTVDPNSYLFSVQRGFLLMPDGVSLAATYFIPKPKFSNETFPVVLEMIPYRKDDFFYQRDYTIYSYFAKRGFIGVRVDVRGTGGSDGAVPSREYSDQEIQDAVRVIELLSKRKDANGNVGMWGISWGGFNALQVRSLRPPALKAIIAMHASDDLYHDDIHYIDGILHMDPYAIGVELDVIFPQSPDYPTDSSYFKNRFNSYPWLFTYLKHQRDGKFWRKKSRRFETSSNPIPIYAIGGLLDGYRDTVLRLLQNEQAPVQAEIGPWNHDFPDVGLPGPNYEWRDRAVDWWNQWLRVQVPPQGKEKSLIAFVREPSLPNKEISAGSWKRLSWPPKNFRQWFPSPGGSLDEKATFGKTPLKYVPSQGTSAGNWWGELTGDMATDDKDCKVFDSPALKDPFEMVGLPEVGLEIKATLPLVHWVVRLEDVFPTGHVALVTGGALNGSQRKSRLNPKALINGRLENLNIPLHFSTWIFRPGHQIRLSICHGQFPMFWPSPQLTESSLYFGPSTFLRLPNGEGGIETTLPTPQISEYPTNAKIHVEASPRVEVNRDLESKTTSVRSSEKEVFEIEGRLYQYSTVTDSSVCDSEPALAKFRGEMNAELSSAATSLKVKSSFSLRSDSSHFYAKLDRFIYKNGKLIETKTWAEKIARDFQ